MRPAVWTACAVLFVAAAPPLAAQAPDTAATPRAPFEGFAWASPDGLFELEIGARVQLLYDHEIPAAGDDSYALSIRRARLALGGKALVPGLAYKFQADFGRGDVVLLDFFGDYRLPGSEVHLRAGQWTVPFSRQQINSSGRLQFVDRALTDKAFGAGRDIGVALHNGYENSPPFEWAAGIFNGTGITPRLEGRVAVDTTTGRGVILSGGTTTVPDRMHPTLAARLGWNHGRVRGYREADFDGGPLRWGVGASARADLDGDGDGLVETLGEVDFALKAYGFAATGAWYGAWQDSGAVGGPRRGAGYHLQAGQLLGGRFEPALRYTALRPGGDDDDVEEYAGAFSIYFAGHDLKWQSDFAVLRSERAGGHDTDHRLRSQLQLAF